MSKASAVVEEIPETLVSEVDFKSLHHVVRMAEKEKAVGVLITNILNGYKPHLAASKPWIKLQPTGRRAELSAVMRSAAQYLNDLALRFDEESEKFK